MFRCRTGARPLMHRQPKHRRHLTDARGSQETFSEYDKMTARELFLGSGVSPLLFRKFLEPVLLALLFVPLEQLSAATALAVLYNYVLAHQPDFDVRWGRGSVSERIFTPWVRRMEEQGARVSGGWRVTRVLFDEDGRRAAGVQAARTSDPAETREFRADYTVLALGVKACPACRLPCYPACACALEIR